MTTPRIGWLHDFIISGVRWLLLGSDGCMTYSFLRSDWSLLRSDDHYWSRMTAPKVGWPYDLDISLVGLTTLGVGWLLMGSNDRWLKSFLVLDWLLLGSDDHSRDRMIALGIGWSLLGSDDHFWCQMTTWLSHFWNQVDHSLGKWLNDLVISRIRLIAPRIGWPLLGSDDRS